MEFGKFDWVPLRNDGKIINNTIAKTVPINIGHRIFLSISMSTMVAVE